MSISTPIQTLYRLPPGRTLVSNNVGIDFTALGPPYGSKPSQAGPKGQGPQKQDDLTTLGFRVKPKEKAIIQDYANRMYNQFIVEPNTRQKVRMLENPRRTCDQACNLFIYDAIYLVPTSRKVANANNISHDVAVQKFLNDMEENFSPVLGYEGRLTAIKSEIEKKKSDLIALSTVLDSKKDMTKVLPLLFLLLYTLYIIESVYDGK